MNVEQRLIEVFQTSEIIEPAPDLWTRVVHSIEEDQRHRQRVVRTAAGILVAIAAFVTVGAMAIEDGLRGRHVHPPTMEALEVLALASLLLALGPAIRRFGRGYAGDLWSRGSTMPHHLLRLMDVAFYLVGAGYILLSTQFEFGELVWIDQPRLGEQLGDASIRIGGLLMLLGVLHALTLTVLPIVALVDNSTRRHRALPKWILLILLPAGLVALFVLQAAVGIGLMGAE